VNTLLENQGILSLINSTPLLKLNRLFDHDRLNIFAKLETFNPGGSIKDRVALNILKQAIKNDQINQDTVVIESSSGNLGIGLAQVCCYLGLRFICVVDPKTTTQNLNLIKAYGAEIEMVSKPDAETQEYLPARLRRVQQLQRQFKNSFWTNQYANPHNPEAYQDSLMPEIIASLGQAPDYLFVAVSTCGSIMGCTHYIEEHQFKTRIVPVDTWGSLIFSDQKRKRLLPGMGAAIKSQFLQPDRLEPCIHVSDLECVHGCRRLLQREAILAGASTGGVVTALNKIQTELPDGSYCVLFIADRGERYLDTVYSDEWIRQQFGDNALSADALKPETAKD
jgi:2,3-diaminopropionate biosynthesis protein SbnA